MIPNWPRCALAPTLKELGREKSKAYKSLSAHGILKK